MTDTRTSINLRVPPEVLAAVDERAKARGISRTRWINRALLNALKQSNVELVVRDAL